EKKLSFSFFLKNLKKNYLLFFPSIIVEPLEQEKNINFLANNFVEKTFNFLGSGKITFEKMAWHEDFRLKKQQVCADYIFNKNCFYQNIIINPGKDFSLVKDIKVPWELSRCYHFSVLGKAFKQTKDKIFLDAFVEQINDWIKENRFMLGANWVCPMEVGIRAISWIVAFDYFKDSKVIDENFWENFVCSLYDHFFYLEHNWEIYDSKTSNHYLSDLVGYFYLCFFFLDLPGVKEKKEWCFQEIVHEFDKQIFDEGANYEGSTTYHVLVAELFYLFFEMCKKNSIKLPYYFEEKFSKMFSFIDWCMPNDKKIITIGDNDSGKILYHGITKKIIQKYKQEKKEIKKDFFEFGLSIVKTKNVHMSLRHHTYKKQQPSGHFHNDALSVTLAVNGMSIFVDPGSYLYTPSSGWRNVFRSTCMHNTFFLDDKEFIDCDERLFFLDIPEKSFFQKSDQKIIKSVHNLYKNKNIQAHRELFFNQEQNVIILADWWQRDNAANSVLGSLKTNWNFVVDPEINLVQEKNNILVFKKKKKLATMSSEDLHFKVGSTFYSSEYGKKVSTQYIFSQADIKIDQKIIIKICL
ncbi:heparinase II/III family protein, partial [bacterium]|nr:heparinase II/III family protein [bacterium]